ncbi:MAG: hypothetical protein PHV93_04560 [Candidatus Pacebacteria bacterium]|nr:hypothetical protein [Candidatus Paceibacterota bacterium]
MKKTACDIVRDYLIEHGYDGLAGDGCGCSSEDIVPCDQYFGNCVPAKKVVCQPEMCAECSADCDGYADGKYYMEEADNA